MGVGGDVWVIGWAMVSGWGGGGGGGFGGVCVVHRRGS